MRIAELYKSLQGEGTLTGVESVFVRASGCNLRCWFCDTPYTSWRPEGEDWELEAIVERVLAEEVPNVVLTGGEPMLYAELLPLCERLRSAGRHITIETAGTLYLPVACDLMSISPKLGNSAPDPARHPDWYRRHERARRADGVVERLLGEYEYQLKFVIDAPADCREVENFLWQFPQVDPQRVWLMPQGTRPRDLAAREAWLRPYCRQAGFHYCPRRHIEWFGAVRGT